MSRWVILRLWLFIFSIGMLLVTNRATCHSLDSSMLQLNELTDGKFMVKWQTTSPTLKMLREPARFPKSCRLSGGELDCGSLGLVGSIEFPWLKGTESRVMVVIDWRSGSRLLRVVDGRAPRLVVYGIPASAGLK